MTEFSHIQGKTNSNKAKTHSTTSSQGILRLYHYIVKIDSLFSTSQICDLQQLSLYLNLTLEDMSQIQTPCIDVLYSKDYFQLKVTKNIDKIEVVDYNLMRKVAKISFKGTDKEFNINYKDLKHLLNISISKRNLFKNMQNQLQIESCKSFPEIPEQNSEFLTSSNII